jgi:hypothetical protein
MADQFNALTAGTLSPEMFAQQQELNRNQQFAQMLMQNNAQPQGQMVSGRYVKPSVFQQLQPLANMLTGAYIAKKGDEKAVDLAQALRKQYSNELEQYQNIRQGTPAQAGGIQGPNGMTTQTTADMYGADMSLNPQYKQVAPIAAQAPNPQAANLYGSNAYNPVLKQYATKKLFEDPSWAEVSEYNQKTGNTDTYLYDKNSPNPETTKRFVATSKPALTLDQRLSLQDRGIAIPNGIGGSMPTGGSMPPAGGTSGSMGYSGGMPAVNTPVKTVSANSVKEPDLVKTLGYDPFKPPPPPAGLPSAEAARAYRADQYKPLEGESRKTVNGAASYQDALDKYVQVLNGIDVTDLANPQVRSRIDAAYNTAMLTGKEAFKLGVLNGGDERILNSLLPNYKDSSQMLVFKDTIKDLAQTQKEFGTGIILKEYGSANKPVPEMYRKHIVVPKSETEGNNQPISFKTEADATKAGLKKGTRVIINGVAGTWN